MMIERHDEIPSTQARALALASTGAPDGCSVLARAQTAGVGRHGHRWASPPGGLWVSIISEGAPAVHETRGGEPLEIPTRLAVSIVGALAARAAIAKVGDLVTRLKWPNDLYFGRRKLGGVIAAEQSGKIVSGIGINANIRRVDLEPEIAASATSILEETGRETDLEKLCLALRSELGERLGRWRWGDPALRDEAEHALIREHRIRWRPGAGAKPVEGRPAGIEPSGALAIDRGGGRRVTAAAGDLEILWPED